MQRRDTQHTFAVGPAMLMSVFDVHVPDMYVIGFQPDDARR